MMNFCNNPNNVCVDYYRRDYFKCDGCVYLSRNIPPIKSVSENKVTKVEDK